MKTYKRIKDLIIDITSETCCWNDYLALESVDYSEEPTSNTIVIHGVCIADYGAFKLDSNIEFDAVIKDDDKTLWELNGCHSVSAICGAKSGAYIQHDSVILTAKRIFRTDPLPAIEDIKSVETTGVVETKDPIKVTVEVVEGSWKRALNFARKTVGKKKLDKEPSKEWKRRILLQEHSPIRAVEYIISFDSVRQWVSVHLTRHWLGFLPFVHSQRSDRRVLDCSRDELPQGSLNDMDVLANAQALINVSRKRLCGKASPETRHAWKKATEEMEKVDPEMASVMVPECIYRGFCPYGKDSCQFCNTDRYQEELKQYRESIKEH
jgi:hypothetical protein